MARQASPWYRKSKDAWFIKLDGKQVALGVHGPDNKTAATRAWHRLLREGPSASKLQRVARLATKNVKDAVGEFLSVVKERNKPTTHELYERHLKKLNAKLGRTRVSELTVPVLAKWLHSLKVSATTQAITLRSLSVFLGWCVRQEIIDKNPATAVAKPKAKSRGEDAVISPDDHAKLLELATPQLRLFLTILHATGARPGEVCAFTAENFDPSAGVVKLANHKTDHTGRMRLIFLPPDAVELLKAQAEKYKNGPLLRNRLGRAWTAKAVAWQVNRLCKRAGIKVIPYGYRHTLATDALAHGVPDAHVAQLLGHGSTAMLHRHYAHLGTKAKIMSEAVRRVR